MNDIDKKFVSKFNKVESGCWEWAGFVSKINERNNGGYGDFYYNNKTVKAHRYSYELFKGKIPRGLQIDHLCRNRKCVNPDHLEAVTAIVNILRGEARSAKAMRRNTCVNGHEYAPDNTYIRTKKNRPSRVCRTCAREWILAERKKGRFKKH